MTPDLVDGAALGPVEHARLYERLLVPAFPAAERDGPEEYLAAVADGAYRVTVARAGTTAVGLIVLEDQAGCGTTLVAYLAVDPGRRGGGVGSALVRRAVADNRHGLLLAEVEDPRRHADSGFGDPRRRAAFYGRLGALVLDVPYYQPPIAPGVPAVPGMMLLALALGPAAPPPGHRVPTATVRCFLASQARHDVAATPERAALRHRLEQGPPVRLVPLADRLSAPLRADT